MRLHSVEKGEGLLGSAWESKQPHFLAGAEKDPRLKNLRDTKLQTESAMIIPLLYAGEDLGLLAVANGPMSMPFTHADFESNSHR